LDTVSKFQFSENTESQGYFVGFANNIGYELKFMIMKNDFVILLHRGVVRSAADASHRNKKMLFMSDEQESLILLETKPSFVYKDSSHKY
jgi:hypothetical protein